MKGIILAGGTGSRLYPLTQSINKQLLPVYDVPMIYFPLCTLLYAGITEICVVSSPEYLHKYQQLLNDGRQWGVEIKYREQPKPQGIAQAFLVTEDFIGEDDVTLVLGDNIFHGDINHHFNGGAKIFAYEVNNPQDYGVVQFDVFGKAVRLEEKPKEFVSKYAVPGLYVYDNDVVDIAKNLKPSARGELEITDVNKVYLEQGRLQVSKLPQGFVWLDAGTPQSLHQASSYVETIQTRQGLKIACPEQIAFQSNLINSLQLTQLISTLPSSDYKEYLITMQRKSQD